MAVFDGGVFDSGVFDAGGATTVESSFSADAVIREGQADSFTANAVIQREQSSSFTADETTRKGQTGSFAADAFVLGWFTADATIEVVAETHSSDFTADAIPRLVRVDGFGGYSLVFGTIESSFSADAIVAVEVLFDDFNRTVESGLGGIWLPWWNQWGHGQESYVYDGYITQPAQTDNAYVGFPKIRYGLVQFDVQVGQTFGPDDGWLWTAVEIWDEEDGAYWEIEIWDEEDGTLGADVWPNNADSALYVPVIPGTWYTVKALVNSFADEDVRIKIWARDTPEPDWQWNSTNQGHTTTYRTYSYLELEGSYGSDALYDNIRFTAFEAGWKYDRLFNADAWIIANTSPVVRPGVLLAKAYIYSPYRAGAFFASAVIRVTVYRASPDMRGSTDTFYEPGLNVGNMTSLRYHVPDSGPQWYDDSWAYAYRASESQYIMRIGQSYGTDGLVRLQTNQSDYDISFHWGAYTNTKIGVFMRDDRSGNAIWAGVGFGNGTPGNGWADVASVTGGGWSWVQGRTFNYGQWYSIRITLVGDEASIYVDGSLAYSRTLSNPSTATEIKITGSTAASVIDNWSFPYKIAESTTFTGDAYVAHWFAAKAIIAPYEGWRYGEIAADALVALPLVHYPIFEDTFTRTSSAPPFAAGIADTGQEWFWSSAESWVASAEESKVYTDGGALVIGVPWLNAGPSDYTAESLYISPPPTISFGEVWLDFYIPPRSSYWYGSQVIRWTDNYWSVAVVDYSSDTYPNRFRVETYDNFEFTVERENWYRLRVVINAAASGIEPDYQLKAYVWKVGDAQPGDEEYLGYQDDWGYQQTWYALQSRFQYQLPILAVETSPIDYTWDGTAHFDNIKVYGNRSFKADAIFRVVMGGADPGRFIDEFRRTVAEWDGWGESWVLTDGLGAVDGEYGYVPLHDVGEFENPDIVALDEYELQLVFKTQPIRVEHSGWQAYIYLEYGELWVDAWPYDWPDSDPFLLDFTLDGVGRITESILVSADSWYTLKLRQTETNGYLKVWKVGESEPDEWLITVGATSTWDMSFYMDVEGAETFPTYIDRLEILPLGFAFGGQGYLSFTADATFKRPEIFADAMFSVPRGDLFLAAAVISADYFTVSFQANSVIYKSRTVSFTASAWIFCRRTGSVISNAQIDSPPTIYRDFFADAVLVHATFVANAFIQPWFRADAQIIVPVPGSFVAKAYFETIPVTQYGEATLDSWIIGTVSTFVADAQVSVPVTVPNTFTAEAEKSATYHRFSIPTDFVVLDRAEDGFICYAEIVSGYFQANARIMPVFTANAYVASWFRANACLRVPRGSTWTADAIVKAYMGPVNGGTRIPSPVLIKFDIWWSAYNDLIHSERMQLRRDDRNGELLWQGVDHSEWWSQSGFQLHDVGEYLDTSPTTGKYVLSVLEGSYGADMYIGRWSFWAEGLESFALVVYKTPSVYHFWVDGGGGRMEVPGALLDVASIVVTADAWIQTGGSLVVVGGEATVDAWIIPTRGSFTADAVIPQWYFPGSFTADAWSVARWFRADAMTRIAVQGEIENAAIITAAPSGTFTTDALIRQGIRADAFIQPWFRADAYIRREFESRLWFTANAYIYDPRWFTANAYLYKPGVTPPPPPTYTLSGTVTIGGVGITGATVYVIAADGTYAGSTVTGPGGTWSIVVPPGTYTIYVVPPEYPSQWYGQPVPSPVPVVGDTGGVEIVITPTPLPPIEPQPGDPNPPPAPPPPAGPPPQYSKIRILIKSGTTTTDITADVAWAETEFTQAARTAPGTFRCTLRGEFTQYDGGEDIYVEVDGFRQFGGLVTMVEYDYWYPNIATPKTVLLGVDYNIYFDKLVLWNREENPGTSGEYINFRGYRADLSDRSIIRHVCAHMIDLPPGFDYLTYVDKLDDNWLDGERYYFNTGMSFREFMSEMSRVTAGVWWIDQHLALHYHARGVVTAPAAITDTRAGVSCRNLEWRGDTGSMVNDIRVWGTLANTVAGKIAVSHNYNADAIAKYGLRQYGEFRSDLHDTDHIRKRASSIRHRRGVVIETASLDIFESGFTAGQVVWMSMTTFGKAKAFVIRQVQTKFPVIGPPDGTTYYGIPMYHLELGLDPEDPWNFYDMLPFDIPPWDVPLGFVYPQWGGFEICQSESATDTEFIAHTVTFFEEDGMGFGDIWPTEGFFWPLSLYQSSSPYKWGPLAGYHSGYHVGYTTNSATKAYLQSGSEWIPMLFGANMGGHLRLSATSTQNVLAHYEWATPLREGLFGVDVSAFPRGTNGTTNLMFSSSGALTYPLGIDLDHQSGGIGGSEWWVKLSIGRSNFWSEYLSNQVELFRGKLEQPQAPFPSSGPPTFPYGEWVGYYTKPGNDYVWNAPTFQNHRVYENQVLPDRFWLRIRVDDDRIRVKIWDMCGTEPTNWEYETDSCPIAIPLLGVGTLITMSLTTNYPSTGNVWTTLPEVQFSAIELSSTSGSGYLVNPDWPRSTSSPYSVISKFDINDHSGPWPPSPTDTRSLTEWPVAPQTGTAWYCNTNLPWLTYDFHWNDPSTYHLSAYSTNDPATGTVYERKNHTADYCPYFSVTLDWPLFGVWDTPEWVTGEMMMSTGAATNVNFEMRSVLRPSWAPYTFHFKAELTVALGLSGIGAWMFFPNRYGTGGFFFNVYKYTGDLDCPTVDADGRLVEKELIDSFWWSGDPIDPVYTTVEWSYTFKEGETRLIYHIEIMNDWLQLCRQQGIFAWPLAGVMPTRHLYTIWRNPEMSLEHGEPTPDPLNGITRLPGIFTPLDVMPTKTVGYQSIIDSGDISIAVRDMPRWGWFTETVLVNNEGYFISSGGYVRGSFSVWYAGDHLIPEQDWVSVGPVGEMGSKLWRFQLTAAYRARNTLVGMVSLTYLIDNPAADPGWTRPSRTTVTDVLADRNRMIDIRGLN